MARSSDKSNAGREGKSLPVERGSFHKRGRVSAVISRRGGSCKVAKAIRAVAVKTAADSRNYKNQHLSR